MRIGLVLSSTPAYSETFFTSKIKGLKANGHTVIVFVQHRDPAFKLCEVAVAPRVFRWKWMQLIAMFWTFLMLLASMRKVRRFVRLEKNQDTSKAAILKRVYLNAHILSQKVDWLHFGFATQALGKEYTAEAIGAKMAVSFRGFDINVYPLKHPDCYDLLWKRVDKVHSISKYLLERAYQMGLSKSVAFQLITPAVSIDSLPESRFSTMKDPLKLVTVARLHWIKGLDTSISAMQVLKAKGVNFTYHILGGGGTKDIERYLYQAYQLGLSEQIVFHGKMAHSDTLEFLKTTDIYLQPSLNEGFCNAVLESQAMGIISVVSNTGGLPENVVDGETGWLVEKGNKNALADKILDVLKLSEGERKVMSQNARQRVKTDFSMEKQKEEFLEFYIE